jgi:ionotropic glutamate receptor
VDLVRNAQVQVIIHGAETDAEAEFVARIGGRAHVPVLSFSATPSAPAPFSLRASADDSDSSQAATVAAVLRNFRWRAAVLLHEDSSSGAAIAPALSDALRGVGASVAHRAAVPAGASDDRLDAVLYRVSAATTTRVFVAHMPLPLALRLFRRAVTAGMMSEGYVWIATAAVGEAGALSPEDADAMRGVVAVRRYAPPTSQATDFAQRFTARIQQDNDGARDIPDPTVSTLRAYDAAWATAAAVEVAGISGSAFKTPEGSTGPTELDRLGVSATGKRLLKALRDTAFDGLAGKFRTLDGQLQTSAYEIVNFAAEGARTVGFWTRKSGMSPEFAGGGGEGLKDVVFPGLEQSDIRVPKGWVFSPAGQELVIAVPVKHGFPEFVQVYNDTTSNRTVISGYCIDVFEAAIKVVQLQHPVPVYYRYEPFYGIGGGKSGSYDQLVDLVTEQVSPVKLLTIS